MSQQAGVIFAGQVLAIHRQESLGEGTGWVEVDFQIAQAVRGCTSQGVYVLREWAGLWTGGRDRYRVGQRLLMLLHTPSASGLTSPVGGQVGAIPITGDGAAPGPKDEFVTAGEQAVDLRWVQTRLERTTSNRERFHGKPIAPLDPVFVGRERTPMVTRKVPILDARNNQRLGANAPSGSGFVPASAGLEDAVNQTSSGDLALGATLRGVLAMLGAWEAEQANAAR
ncbi:hypothetical protein [Granulicella arctica]|uniref:Uncharacterized protein n=1 Tax=Granulicella arctica TaxID=940613 RepID=A0A7Y9TEQ1_9BACT|nr:hypothetical protein [Granulicella arctica]NYF77921.1 hypothetical protein [Granulicella arctica]